MQHAREAAYARFHLASQAGPVRCIQVQVYIKHKYMSLVHVNTKVQAKRAALPPAPVFLCLPKACIVQMDVQQDAIFMHFSRALVKPAQRAQPFRESDDSLKRRRSGPCFAGGTTALTRAFGG
jgi:hypothetical protein